MPIYGYLCSPPSNPAPSALDAEAVSQVFIDPPTAWLQPFLSRPEATRLDAQLQPGDTLITPLASFSDPCDCALTLESWQERGIRCVIVLDKGYRLDMATPLGQLLLHTLHGYLETQKAFRMERAQEAAEKRRREGKAMNQFPGYGFKRRGRKGSRKSVPDEHEREVMAYIVTLRRDHHLSWRQIYSWLLETGVRTTDGREWSPWRIQRAFMAELWLRAQEAAAQAATAGTGALQEASVVPPSA